MVAAAVHAAHHPTRSVLERRYEHAYRAVARRLGPRVPGRDIVRYGLPDGLPASPAVIRRSLGVLERMLRPPARSVSVTPVAVAPTSASPTSTTSSGLAACILQRESTNGQASSNIAQWQPSTWVADHGPQMTGSPTPSGASYSQQVGVLNAALAAGKSSQWTPYDGC